MALAQGRVRSTRLRWVSAKDPAVLSQYFDKIKRRVQIYSIVEKGGRFYCWFVPGDLDPDIKSVDL